MVDITKPTAKKLTQSDIRGVFLRSNLLQGSWNFERMQALGFCYSMVPLFVVFILKIMMIENKPLSAILNSLIHTRMLQRLF